MHVQQYSPRSPFTKGEDDLFGRDMVSCGAALLERGMGGDLSVDLWIAPYGGAERWAVTQSEAIGFAGGLFTPPRWCSFL